MKAAQDESDPDMLEAPFVILCNDMFHQTSERVKERDGKLDTDTIFFEWHEWLERETLKRRDLKRATAPKAAQQRKSKVQLQ
ncbi:TPA: hypothetical protein HA251_07075 [Candidatus Woesearchaeota archaeon]|nr:hypothetical protein [Candidatus Woesearchaeota archaeon]